MFRQSSAANFTTDSALAVLIAVLLDHDRGGSCSGCKQLYNRFSQFSETQAPPFIPQGCRYFVLLALFIALLGVLQKQAVATCVRIYMRRWVLMSTPAGVVQGRLLFVVVVQAGCDVVLLFLFEHFNTVQCPTLRNSSSSS